MTDDMRFFIGLGVTVALNAGLIGAAWGNLSTGQKHIREDMDNVKKALGLSNGSTGRVVTREEYAVEGRELRRRIELLESAGDRP